MDAFELADFHRAIEEYFEAWVYPDIAHLDKTPSNFRFTYEGQDYVIGIKGDERDVCDTCLGYGVIERRDGSELNCPDCDGYPHLEPDLKDIITLEEHQANEVQKQLIRQRYGTLKPASIADYWR